VTQASPASAYTLDVDYRSLFGAHQTPVHLSVSAGLWGYGSPDPARPFRYLDIGCGDGAIACSIAAAYPHAEVLGLDLSPSHIAKARAFAAQTGLTNVRFLQADLGSWRELDLPPFDFAAVAGLYAWLDAARRADLHAFLAAGAKPGALVYVDYAASPGCASIEPLYRVLRQLAGDASEDTVERLRAAAEDVRALAAGGAKYFVDHPAARRRLDSLFAAGGEIEAHEVFNFTEPAPWFEDVAAAFEAHGMVWAGSTFWTTGFAHLVLPDALANAAASPDRRLAETLKDLAMSTGRRADVFVCGEATLIGSAAALGPRPILAPVRADVWRRAAARSSALRAPWIERLLAQSLATLADAFAAARTAGGPNGAPEAAVRELVALGALPVGVHAFAEPIVGHARLTRFNAHVLDVGLDQVEPPALVSPVAGSRLILPLLDRLALYACTGGDIGRAYARLRGAGLNVDAGFGPGVDGFAAGVGRMAERFGEAPLTRLARLGVVVADRGP
jgi:trans-aconitate methyltransferase